MGKTFNQASPLSSLRPRESRRIKQRLAVEYKREKGRDEYQVRRLIMSKGNASETLSAFLDSANSWFEDDEREMLVPFINQLKDSAADAETEKKRRIRIIDWAAREMTPLALERHGYTADANTLKSDPVRTWDDVETVGHTLDDIGDSVGGTAFTDTGLSAVVNAIRFDGNKSSASAACRTAHAAIQSGEPRSKIINSTLSLFNTLRNI